MNFLHEGRLKGGRHMATRSEYVFPTYTGYYQQQLEESKEFQDFLTKELSKRGIHIQCFSSKKYQWEIGESACGTEIKYDKMFSQTGNLYIETHEKANPANLNYAMSGINRENIIHWVQGDYGIVFMFSKRELSRYIFSHADRLRFVVKDTSQGYLLPKFDADKICIAKFRFQDKELFETVISNQNEYNRFIHPISARPASESSLKLFGVTA